MFSAIIFNKEVCISIANSRSVRNLTQGKIFSQILLFAIPVIIGNLLQELYNVVDTLIVGQTLGEIKLAAVGSTSSLNFFALGFFIGLSAGCSVITSQHFGAGNIEQVKKSVAAHILIGVVSSVVLTAAFVFLVNPFLTMLGTDITLERIKEGISRIKIIAYIITIKMNKADIANLHCNVSFVFYDNKIIYKITAHLLSQKPK